MKSFDPSPRMSSGIVASMIAMIVLPAFLTLHTVHTSALNSGAARDPHSSPYGYTVSLLLFIVPIFLIGFWFIPRQGIEISRKSFWWTIGLLFPLGAGLDFFFARFFFVFPNRASTLGILAPALGSPIPVEEYVFYLTGFLCTLLLYVWFDEYWLNAYKTENRTVQGTELKKLFQPHYESIFLAFALVTGAIVYKKYFSNSPAGFPGYFIFLALIALIPPSALLPTVRPVINWRAFSFTAFFILLVSLLWEVTLAIPYGWWNFADSQMLGIRITAWGDLPIEEVVLWIAVTCATVIVYETVKCWHASRPSGSRHRTSRQ